MPARDEWMKKDGSRLPGHLNRASREGVSIGPECDLC